MASKGTLSKLSGFAAAFRRPLGVHLPSPVRLNIRSFSAQYPLPVCAPALHPPLEKALRYTQAQIPDMQDLLAALPPSPPLFRYEFREPLLEGVVQQRKGRFTLEVLVDGEVLLCHCPSTALNPNKDLLNSGKVPCLVSRADTTVKRTANKQRQTQHTVEAISLDDSKSWIGINQVMVGRYVGHFLQAGGLPEICKDPQGLKAEQKVGKCRIDFVHQGRDTIELKMFPPKILRPVPRSMKGAYEARKFSERITSQLHCMVEHLHEQRAARGLPTPEWGLGRQQLPEDDNPRAMLLMCYQNNEPRVKVPKGALRSDSPVTAAFSAAKKAGVEFWQVNMQIDRKGVTLASYAPRNLFSGRPKQYIANLQGRTYLADPVTLTRKRRTVRRSMKPERVITPDASSASATAAGKTAVPRHAKEPERVAVPVAASGAAATVRAAAAPRHAKEPERVTASLASSGSATTAGEPAAASQSRPPLAAMYEAAETAAGAAGLQLWQLLEVTRCLSDAAAVAAAQRRLQERRGECLHDPAEAAQAARDLVWKQLGQGHRDPATLAAADVVSLRMSELAAQKHSVPVLAHWQSPTVGGLAGGVCKELAV